MGVPGPVRVSSSFSSRLNIVAGPPLPRQGTANRAIHECLDATLELDAMKDDSRDPGAAQLGAGRERARAAKASAAVAGQPPCGAGIKDGGGLPRKAASLAATRKSSSRCPCWRQDATTVSRRSVSPDYRH